ncbi:MAG TPA: outer membrane beta-barrel protein [Syntrophales bacterium]|jgi:opacity protein-like surface antigen|nr:outer membrane beta-barrel protein [Syntrophales bacterium]HPI58458.1 outer membrane beta-barrel protein [Syntrophales bacterium]HPN25958.1 outer membrane beta-barrel protein [Syntrophales bacterium]HQM28796.1 outer membrane beta-barrel protein [Syntrophales bacterium]
MSKARFAVSVLLISLFIVLLPAGDVKAQYRPFYVGVFGGYTMPEDMEVSSSAVGDYHIDLDNGGMLGVKFGYIPPGARFLALEFELNGMWNDYDRQAVFTTPFRGEEEGDATLANFMFNLLFRYPEGRIHPYAGFGIGWSSVTLDGKEYADGVLAATYDDDDTSFAWQFLAGLTFEIAPSLELDLGYRYFWTEPEFGVSDVEFKSHIATIGLNFHF